MRNIIKTVLALTLILATLCSSALAASYGAKVLVKEMVVYNAEQEAAGSLKQGTSIKVTDMSGDWVRISYKGKTGYAKIEDICFNKGIKAVSTKDTGIRFVTKESYKENTYYKGTLSEGVSLYVVGKKGDLALVSNGSDALGYVKLSALSKVN